MNARSTRNARPRLVWRRTFTVLALALLFLGGACDQSQGSQSAIQPTATSAPAAQPAALASAAYWPTAGWRTSTPEEQGVDSQQLLRALQRVDEAGINLRSLTVIRNGYIVLEAYYQPWTSDLSYQIWSSTKSVIGALTGIAINEGYLKDVNQSVLGFFPELTIANRDSSKDAITIKDLLTMQPGLDCSDKKIGLPSWDKNWVQYILDLPMDAPPGQKFAYCSDGPHLLSAILTKATHMSTAFYAQSRLFNPLGIERTNLTWDMDPQGINTGGYGMSMKPRDMAKFGLLYLNNGRWEDKQIVPQEWVAASTRVYSSERPGKRYGYLIWVYPEGPAGFIATEGLGSQVIQVVKDRNMVVVMTSAINDKDGQTVRDLLTDYIIPAAVSTEPLPANPAAQQALQDKVEYLADPLEPVPPLRPIARQVSGKTYVMQDNNPAGWKTLSFEFVEGSPELKVAVVSTSGEETVSIGLDNVYRMQRHPDGSFTARRGQWVDDHTFAMRQLESSTNIEEYQYRVTFNGDDLKIHLDGEVFNTTSLDVLGTARQGR